MPLYKYAGHIANGINAVGNMYILNLQSLYDTYWIYIAWRRINNGVAEMAFFC